MRDRVLGALAEWAANFDVMPGQAGALGARGLVGGLLLGLGVAVRDIAGAGKIAMEAQRELAEDDAGEELPETPHEIILGRIAQLITDRPEDAAKLIRTMLIEEAQRNNRGAS